MYGVRPDFVFQRAGRSSHTATAVQDFREERFPKFWSKTEWPANSPDLNPLDYFAWGYLQAKVDRKEP